MESKKRSEEPSMNELLSGGYEAYTKHDYTKNKAELTNKIKKMKREYISENHDNYRKPEFQLAEDEVDVTAAMIRD